MIRITKNHKNIKSTDKKNNNIRDSKNLQVYKKNNDKNNNNNNDNNQNSKDNDQNSNEDNNDNGNNCEESHK